MAKANLNSQKRDEITGEAVDPSDGRALEAICADFMGRPEYNMGDGAAIVDYSAPALEEDYESDKSIGGYDK